MAWTTPRTWIVGEMVTHTILNIHWRDQLNNLDNHRHSGSAGDGSGELRGVAIMTFQSQGASPASTGTLQMNGTNLEYRNGSATVLIRRNLSAGTVGLRTLGTDGTQISNGTHKHA